MSARHEEHFFGNNKSLFIFVTEHLAIVAFCTMHFGKYKPQDVSSLLTTRNEIESLGQVGPCRQVGTDGLKTCFTWGLTLLSDISNCASFLRELRHPPELSLSGSVASHKGTQNKAPSSSIGHSSLSESSVGSTLLLKPFLLRLEHLYVRKSFLTYPASDKSRSDGPYLCLVSLPLDVCMPQTPYVTRTGTVLGTFSSILYNVWKYSFHLGECEWTFDELNKHTWRQLLCCF